MQAILDDCFLVVVREKDAKSPFPATVERELITCPTYEQAQWVKRECSGPGRTCIIRFIGTAGGGD